MTVALFMSSILALHEPVDRVVSARSPDNDWHVDPATVAVAGGETGVQVLVGEADEAGMTNWRVAAALTRREAHANTWEGYGCASSDGRFAAVGYGPTLQTPTSGATGFAAIVDLRTGDVRDLDVATTMRYHSPRCSGMQAAFTFEEPNAAGASSTRVAVVDLESGRVDRELALDGEWYSVVPRGEDLVGFKGREVVEVRADGARRGTAVDGSPTQLTLGAKMKVEFLVVADDGDVHFARGVPGARVELTPVGKRGQLTLRNSSGGNVLAGRFDGEPPSGVRTVTARTPPLAVRPETGDALLGVDAVDQKDDRPAVQVQRGSNGNVATQDILYTEPTDPSLVPSAADADDQLAVADESAPACAVGRNEPAAMVHQPSIDQVEWAVSRAVRGELTSQRPVFWNSGNGTYRPQGLIPPPSPLRGGGRIPASVLLAVVIQESNLKQASWRIPRGMHGNALIADYYGSRGEPWVDFDDADCGYGLGQVTDGMRADSSVWTSLQQQAIAYDYQANIAASAKILADKWNQLHDMGVLAQSGDASDLEAWYFALWAYNTGAYDPGSHPSGQWGVGWTNNPSRDNAFDPNRAPYLKNSYDDAKYPSRWPYQERVFGWMSYGFYESGTRQVPTMAVGRMTPAPKYAMCSDSNDCIPGETYPATGSYCHRDDNRCWWHESVQWDRLECVPWGCQPDGPTASEPFADESNEPLPPDPPHDPACNADFPAGTRIVDNLATSINRVGCPVGTSQGTFDLEFLGGTSSEIDFHQIAAGYGGHTWFSHTRPFQPAALVRGTWKPDNLAPGTYEIRVHVPAIGAESPQAGYRITEADGEVTRRVLNQRWNENRWASLGRVTLGNNAAVSLTNWTPDDWGYSREVNVAWDALAFIPSTPPQEKYVALGDSYSAGEGLEPYEPPTDVGGKFGDGGPEGDFRNGCHRSSDAYPVLAADALNVDEFHFIACSASTTDNLRSGASGETRWTEVSQANQGYLDASVTKVSLSIGGNDAEFSGVLQSCMTGLNCHHSDYYRDGDPEPLGEHITNTLIPRAANGLSNVLDDVTSLAPNADIVVVGYPRLFGPGNYVWGPTEVSMAEGGFLNDKADELNAALRQVTEQHAAIYVDPTDAFVGHAVGDLGGEWINGIINWSSTGSSPSGCELPNHSHCDLPGTGSFHPNSNGHDAFASLVVSAFSNFDE